MHRPLFSTFSVQRFGTGTLSAGVLRATYGNGKEDGMSAFLAGRALDFSPDTIQSAYERCKKALDFCLEIVDEAFSRCRLDENGEFIKYMKKCRKLRREAYLACVTLAYAKFAADMLECQAQKDSSTNRCEQEFKACLEKNY